LQLEEVIKELKSDIWGVGQTLKKKKLIVIHVQCIFIMCLSDQLGSTVDKHSNDLTLYLSFSFQDDNHMPQDDLDDAGALDLDFKDSEYKMPPMLFKKHHHSKYKRRKMSTNLDSESVTSQPGEGNAVKSEVLSEAGGQKGVIEGSSESETAALIGDAVPIISADGSVSFYTGSQDGQDESSFGQVPVCQVNYFDYNSTFSLIT
jgi:hypothetical protein